MATPTVTYTFVNATTANATEVNTNFSDLINAMTDSLKDFAILSLTVASTITVTGQATFDGILYANNDIDTDAALPLAIGETNCNALNLSKAGVATTVKGTFNCDEAATFDTTLGVTGATTLSSTLAVTSIASFAAGAAATPSIARTGDLNTGIWFSAADTINMSCGGTEYLELDATSLTLETKAVLGPSTGLTGSHIIQNSATGDFTLTIQNLGSGAGAEVLDIIAPSASTDDVIRARVSGGSTLFTLKGSGATTISGALTVSTGSSVAATFGSAAGADHYIQLRNGVGGFLGWDDSANVTILQAPNTRKLRFQVNSDTFSGGTNCGEFDANGYFSFGPGLDTHFAVKKLTFTAATGSNNIAHGLSQARIKTVTGSIKPSSGSTTNLRSNAVGDVSWDGTNINLSGVTATYNNGAGVLYVHYEAS